MNFYIKYEMYSKKKLCRVIKKYLLKEILSLKETKKDDKNLIVYNKIKDKINKYCDKLLKYKKMKKNKNSRYKTSLMLKLNSIYYDQIK